MKFASLAMLASLSVAGCASTATPPNILPIAFNPADPAQGVRDTHHHPVVIDYNRREPAAPTGWRRPPGPAAPAAPSANGAAS